MRSPLPAYARLIAAAMPWLAALLVASALASSDGAQPAAAVILLLLLPLLVAGYWRPCRVSPAWRLTLLLPLLSAIPLFIGSGTGEALDGPSRSFIALLVLLVLMHLPLDRNLILRSASLGGIIAVLANLPDLGEPRVNWGPGYLDSGYIGVLLLSLCFAHFHVERGHRLWRLVAIAGAACLLFAIMKTGTRGAWPAMFCILLLQLVGAGIRRRHTLLLALAGAVLLGMSAWLLPTVRDRIELTVFEIGSYYQENNRASSVGYRLDFWDIALTCFRESPLWGVSYPRRAEIIQSYVDDHPASASIGIDGRSSSHNEIMDALAKRGLLGAVAVLLLYLVPLRYFVGVVRRARDPTLRHLGIAGAGLVLSMIICGVTEAPLMNVRVGTTFVFLLIFLYRLIEPAMAAEADPAAAAQGIGEGKRSTNSSEVPASGSLHFVRRYGPVGGMELYVWELTHALAAQGHPVHILCEEYEPPNGADCDPAITVTAIGRSRWRKPRWLGLVDFDRRASSWLAGFDTRGWVLHSHERTRSHHVTTFHGPSIHSRRRRALDGLSLRLRAWEWLERRELTAPSVRIVYPVSDFIGDTLASLYPESRDRIADPAWPGVHPRFTPLRDRPRGRVIGFIGVEWERKGLDLLARAVASIRANDPTVTLCVAGCAAEHVCHLFQGWGDGVTLLGWADPLDFYRQVDLLALPARNEPYGMVVAEANATGLPVVVSDHCGIASLIDDARGAVVPVGDVDALAAACIERLGREQPPPPMGLTWQAQAERHARDYAALLASPGEADAKTAPDRVVHQTAVMPG